MPKSTYVDNTIATDPPGGKRHTVKDMAGKLPTEEVTPGKGTPTIRQSTASARKAAPRKSTAARKAAKPARKTTAKKSPARPAARKPSRAKKAARARR